MLWNPMWTPTWLGAWLGRCPRGGLTATTGSHDWQRCGVCDLSVSNPTCRPAARDHAAAGAVCAAPALPRLDALWASQTRTLRHRWGNATATMREDARVFWPTQIGVAVRSGAEKAVHAARRWYSRNIRTANRVSAKLDFANAFNTVDRATVLSQLGKSFPGLARWTHWCYGSPSHLRFGAHQLSSSSGVQLFVWRPARRPAGIFAFRRRVAAAGHRMSGHART